MSRFSRFRKRNRRYSRRLLRRRKFGGRRRYRFAPPRIRVGKYRRFKRARFANKGKLALQARLQGGGSLPKQTYARFLWKGSAVVDMRGGVTGTYEPETDLVFSMVNIHRPTYNSFASQQHALRNLQGEFSYKHIWANLYRECMVLGSKMRLQIRKPLYPSGLAKIWPG